MSHNKKRRDNEDNNESNILSYEEYQEKIKGLKTSTDAEHFVRDLVAPVLQEMLEAEMTEHLGYEKNSVFGNNTGNSRNGHFNKTVKGNLGNSNLQVPRDRNGSFEPKVVKKYQTTSSSVEEKIISMYAKGMTSRDINSHMKEIYGVDVSAGMVSTITDKVLPLVTEWQNRPLESMYPIVYLDGIHFRVRDGGKIVKKCGYTILGINLEGKKEMLGLWIGENESAKFWLQVLNELKHRGVEDILICCIDGLKGFSEAIEDVFPESQVQQCVIHMVRNTIKFVTHKEKKKFCQDLKTIYSAPTEEAGLQALDAVKENWPGYLAQLKRWETNWTEISTFFQYPEEIRRIIYTTNAVESLHRQLRKVTKTTSVFPHDESLKKLLWLAQNDITKKWYQPIPNWGKIISQFSIMFPERVEL